MKHRFLLLLGLYLGLILVGILIGSFLPEILDLDIRPGNEPDVHRMIMLTTVIYILAAAIPFVPGAEIGFALLMTLGASIAGLVYVSMVGALTVSYLVGCFVPTRAIAGFFHFFGLSRARDLVIRLQPLSTQERLELLIARAPVRLIPFLLRHRFLALAVVINMPGNTLLGGGGGIALIAGMSGLFPFLGYLVTIAAAVAPLPVLITLTA